MSRVSVPQTPTREFYNSVSYKSVNCLGVCFRVRVCIRVRGFHLVFVQGALIGVCAQFLKSAHGPTELEAIAISKA